LTNDPSLCGKISNSCSSVKDPSCNILNDENETLARWREYFEDLFNTVKTIKIAIDTHEPLYFGEQKIFTASEVARARGRLKSGTAAGEYESDPKC